MKLLHIITTVDVGGAEMHILSQVRGQVAAGHEVRVAYILGQGTLVPDFLEAGASEVFCVGTSPLAIFRLRKHLRWCSIVHTHLLRADFTGGLAATLWGRRSRLVSGKHNDEHALKTPMVARLHGVLGRLPKRTIVLSKHVGEYMRTVGQLTGKGMVCIPYGIDPKPFAVDSDERERLRAKLRSEFGFGSGDVVWICVARLAHQKAHDVLIEALAEAHPRCHAQGTTLRLLIVGDDPFGDGRAKVEGWAREAGVLDSGHCVLTGIRRDVPGLMAGSDGFVMPSRWEGLGLVFLEAMAAGLPVLSTRVSAIPEVVVSGETGELVAVDNPGELADRLVSLTLDRETREALGAAGALRVRKEFSLETMVESTLAVYRELDQGKAT